MKYLALFSDQEIARLADWMEANGELYVDIDYPHSGGVGPNYRVRSMSDLKALVAEQEDKFEVVFTIFQRLQFPLRGAVNDELLARALGQIADGEWYRIVSLNVFYPSMCVSLGGGNSHAELRQDFAELDGEVVGVGQDPFDVSDARRADIAGPAFSISVTKRMVGYEPFQTHPDRYQAAIDLWRR